MLVKVINEPVDYQAEVVSDEVSHSCTCECDCDKCLLKVKILGH